MAKGNSKTCEWRGITFRSHFEMEIAKQLSKLGLKWEYEPCKLPWTPIQRRQKTYTPDFRVKLRDGSEFYIEAKGYFYKAARDKMEAVLSEHQDKDIRFIFMDAGTKISSKAKKRPTTYADWCSRRGYTYAEGKFPNEWKTPLGKEPKKKKRKVTKQNVFKETIKTWGLDGQINILMEECGEIITAANHWRRDRISFEDFLEECADAKIVIEQMRQLDQKKFDSIYEKKLQRLIKRVIERNK